MGGWVGEPIYLPTYLWVGGWVGKPIYLSTYLEEEEEWWGPGLLDSRGRWRRWRPPGWVGGWIRWVGGWVGGWEEDWWGLGLLD